jgi:dolichol-phosphate mannosyltransferase
VVENKRQVNMLSILIPAYNEEGTLSDTVAAITTALDDTGWPYEVLVVNDGSTDATEQVLLALETRFRQLRHITNDGPHGYGYAVRCGLADFRGDAVIIAMADGSDAPADMIGYYAKIQEGYDCAFGSRFMPGARLVDYPPLKRRLNRLGNWLIGKLLRQPYNDFTNGFKCYRRPIIEAMQPLVSGQFNLTIEMSIKAIGQDARYAIVPTHWQNRAAGSSKFKLLAQAKLYLLTLLYCLAQVWLVPALARPARPPTAQSAPSSPSSR